MPRDNSASEWGQMPEEPLTDAELRIVRGMIEEYDFAHKRNLLWSQRWKAGRVIALTILGIMLYMLQIVVAIVAIRGK